MSLWKMEFMVEGKHLEKCLEGLVGIALNMQPPQPVTNGAIGKGPKGRVVQQTSPETTQVGRLKHLLLSEATMIGKPLVSGAPLSSGIIRKAMDELGIPKNNYSSLVTTLKNQRFLTTTEKRGALRII